MHRPMRQKLKIVTGLKQDKQALLEERTLDRLLEVLCRRAQRLVDDREVCERLRPVFRRFVYNVVDYFHDTGELDEFTMTNIMTALITADSHDGGGDYSTFIRALNPTDPDAGRYFVVGRAGRLHDPACPLKELERGDGLESIPAAQLHMFHAFHYARSKDTSRDAPKIPAKDFRRLMPLEISKDSTLQEAFLDVCFSDGAWELYQLQLAA